jgi:heterodisulfide reductase subunit A
MSQQEEAQNIYGFQLNNVEDVIELGLCTGCMACIGCCPHGALETKTGRFGFPVPVRPESCDDCGTCLGECPMIAIEDDAE